MKKALACVIVVILGRVVILAQAETTGIEDDLFSSQQDIVADTASNNTDPLQQVTERPKLQFSGSLSATGGVAIGYTQWPDLQNPLRYYDGSAGATAVTTLVMNGNPSSSLSVYGSVSSSLDTGSNLAWSSFTIGSLYFDYYGIQNITIRAGQFPTSWGHGRIFSLGNLMSGSSDDITLRVNFPLLLQGISFFVLADAAYFSTTGGTPAVSEYAYAGILDHVVGPLRLSQGFRYQKKEGLRTLSSLQGTLFGVDLFGDLVLSFAEGADTGLLQSWGYTGGAFKEIGQTRLYGEYQYDSASTGGHDHRLAFVFLQRKLWGWAFDAGFKWEHTFYDGSGTFVPGLSWNGLPHLTIQIAVPLTYGPEGASYVINNEDPAKRRVLLALVAKIDGSY